MFINDSVSDAAVGRWIGVPTIFLQFYYVRTARLLALCTILSVRLRGEIGRALVQPSCTGFMQKFFVPKWSIVQAPDISKGLARRRASSCSCTAAGRSPKSAWELRRNVHIFSYVNHASPYTCMFHFKHRRVPLVRATQQTILTYN